jgi:hypothetical protein
VHAIQWVYSLPILSFRRTRSTVKHGVERAGTPKEVQQAIKQVQWVNLTGCLHIFAQGTCAGSLTAVQCLVLSQKLQSYILLWRVQGTEGTMGVSNYRNIGVGVNICSYMERVGLANAFTVAKCCPFD